MNPRRNSLAQVWVDGPLEIERVHKLNAIDSVMQISSSGSKALVFLSSAFGCVSFPLV